MTLLLVLMIGLVGGLLTVAARDTWGRTRGRLVGAATAILAASVFVAGLLWEHSRSQQELLSGAAQLQQLGCPRLARDYQQYERSRDDAVILASYRAVCIGPH